MSGIWSAFACCFPRKRTRHDEGEGSETNSLLAHSVNGPSGGDTTGNQNAVGQTTTSNKAGSVVSYEVAPAGASTVGYGAVGQGHAVLGEEGRLRVQSIASAVENRMISINHPSQTNYNSQQYSQSRRPTPSKQDLPGNTTRSNSSSPASMAAEDLPEAPPVIHLPPSTAAPDNDTASPARVGGDGNGRPDLGRSRSSTSSSVSQANSGHLAQIEGVRRVNLNLGGMWERERERGRKEKKNGGGSIGGGSGAGVKKSSASVKSGQAQAGVKKDDQEDKDKEIKKKEPEVVAATPVASASTATSRPTEPKLDVNVEPEPAATHPPAEKPKDSQAGSSEPTNTSAPKPNEPESSKPDQPEAPAQTGNDITEAKADGNAAADTVTGADAEADADADAGVGAGGASATGNSGGGGKSGRGKKKKNRGRGRGKGGKGGR